MAYVNPKKNVTNEITTERKTAVESKKKLWRQKMKLAVSIIHRTLNSSCLPFALESSHLTTPTRLESKRPSTYVSRFPPQISSYFICSSLRGTEAHSLHSQQSRIQNKIARSFIKSCTGWKCDL